MTFLAVGQGRRDKAIAHLDGKYCAIPGGPPGLFPAPLPGQSTGGMRQVTLTTTTAVPLQASLNYRDINICFLIKKHLSLQKHYNSDCKIQSPVFRRRQGFP
jgi:hypothetical protein